MTIDGDSQTGNKASAASGAQPAIANDGGPNLLLADDLPILPHDQGRAALRAVERRAEPETPMQKLQRRFKEFSIALARTLVLSLLLTPVLLLSFLTVDLPLRAFDRFFLEPVLKPSFWLSWGVLIMGLGPAIVVLFARRYGGEEASKAVTASWAIAALVVFAELAYLAPELGASDYPAPKFVITFVAAAMAGQYIAAGVYDVTRGGGHWWRAPLYSVMAGYMMQGVIYFVSLYWGTGAPWANWFVSDMAVKFLAALAFLGAYWALREPLKPRGGFGGV